MTLRQIFYDWGGLNAWLFHLVNDIRGDAWDATMRLGTLLADHDNFSYYLAAVLACTALLHWKGKRQQAMCWLQAGIVFSAGYLLEGQIIGWLKEYFNYLRPAFALPHATVHLLGDLDMYHSLPSGHAAFAALLAASLWPVLNPRARILALAGVIWAALSRISLGMHFPADVLAGVLLSIIIAGSLRMVVIRLRPTTA